MSVAEKTDESKGGKVLNFLKRLRARFGSRRAEEAESFSMGGIANIQERLASCINAVNEVTARTRAAGIALAYKGFSEEEKHEFFRILAQNFGPEISGLSKQREPLDDAVGSDDPEKLRKLRAGMKRALAAPYDKLLRNLALEGEGYKTMVDMRAELLSYINKVKGPERAHLRMLEGDMKEFLETGFNLGTLKLRRITWGDPASLLEKLQKYEAVHEMNGFSDIRKRLNNDDRRVYALFHPNMPEDEPLTFVEVAFTDGIADNVQNLLNEDTPPPAKMDTATFYSISNAQNGLRGIQFGNFLIDKVVDEIQKEVPQIKNFVTLSPIPDFRSWLDPLLQKDEPSLLTDAERKQIEDRVQSDQGAGPALLSLLNTDWHQDKQTADTLKPILTRLCSHYLIKQKREANPDQTGGYGQPTARDSVAHFHLSNGARVEQIDWLADTSKKGIKQSAAMMVNYRYELKHVEHNQEQYIREGKIAVNGDNRELQTAEESVRNNSERNRPGKWAELAVAGRNAAEEADRSMP